MTQDFPRTDTSGADIPGADIPGNRLGPRTAVRARTVLPLSRETPARGWEALTAPLEVIDNGVIVAANGRILAVEPYADYCRRADALPPEKIHDLGDVTLTPGLINCHTHLELSWMGGKIAPGLGFPAWLSRLIALDRQQSHASDEHNGKALAALQNALRRMRETGTALAGDITSRIPETVLQTGAACDVALRSFLEVIGHDRATPENMAARAGANTAFSLAGHALYSTPGESFLTAKAWCDERNLPFSMHLAEHEDETECLFGHGRFYEMLRAAIIPAAWTPPKMRPVPYAAKLGLLRKGTVAVHCVTCDDTDIKTLALSEVAVCLCPRSNAFINVGEAPARTLAQRGALLTLGTDSLASNHDLSLWAEAEYFLQKNLLPANALLRMATVNGAAALGFSQGFGRLARNTRFCYTVFPNETFDVE
ncbi:MAG: Atrazine chlorohydrolase [Desulfovibrio sp.]